MRYIFAFPQGADNRGQLVKRPAVCLVPANSTGGTKSLDLRLAKVSRHDCGRLQEHQLSPLSGRPFGLTVQSGAPGLPPAADRRWHAQDGRRHRRRPIIAGHPQRDCKEQKAMALRDSARPAGGSGVKARRQRRGGQNSADGERVKAATRQMI